MNPDRLHLLASFIAERAIGIGEAHAGEAAYTDGSIVFVSAGSPGDHQRCEVLVQSALLGAGSLQTRYIKALRGRPAVARRYLALEGHRVLSALAPRVGLAAAVCPDIGADTATREQSLETALSRVPVADPPAWFGTIRPSRLLRSIPARPATPTASDLVPEPGRRDLTDEDGTSEPGEKSRILRLFELPVAAAATAEFLRKLFGTSPSAENTSPGGELAPQTVRRISMRHATAPPATTGLRFTRIDRAAAVCIRGALYPEWDAFNNRYRPDWCRVIDFPVTATNDVVGARIPRDRLLQRRLSRVGLGPVPVRGCLDGDDLDADALTSMFVDLRSGHSPSEDIFTARHRLARDLGVLILLDTSGSATDADPDGSTVHDHQRRAAGLLTQTLEDLGDRVALYGFRSQGRRSVHLPSVKAFGQRFDAAARTRLGQLRPSGYTRLGAGVRGAGQILQSEAGTPRRLLLVLSDGYPYDDGYEGRYAEADARKALEELRSRGVGCLCLSIGAPADADALERAFGTACHSAGATLADLSPRMDTLFLTALREVSASGPSRV